MKRRTKANEKKANDPYIRSSEVLKLFKDMQDQINEQEKKINSLVQMNKEFKNSVMALYNELEKSKLREKMIGDRQISQMFTNHNQNDGIAEFNKDESTYRCSKEEMMSLFKAFVEKFVQNFNPNQMNNMFLITEITKTFIMYLEMQSKANTQEYIPIDAANFNHNMLQNGPLSSHDSISELRDRYGGTIRKRDSKALKVDPLFEEIQSLKKVSELKSTPSSPKSITRNDLAIGHNRDEFENRGLFLSRNNSILSDYDQHKHIDNISMGSNQKFDEFLVDDKITKPMPSFADHNNFEINSNRSGSDIFKSSNNANNDNKFCGKKRKAITG